MFSNLLVGLVFCMPLVIFFMFNRYSQNRDPARLAVVNFLLTYGTIVLGVYAYEIYLDFKLASFDLDGDGIFSGQERTPEQKKYMRMVTWDTGRTFAPITGLLFSFLYSALYYCILKIYEVFRRNYQGCKKK